MAAYVDGEAPETDSEDEEFSLSSLKVRHDRIIVKIDLTRIEIFSASPRIATEKW